MPSILRAGTLLNLLLLLNACAQNPVNSPPPVEALPAREYAQVLKKNTRKTNQYAGFHQTFQADVTRLDAEMITAILRQKAQFFEWDQRRYQAERDKAIQEGAAFAKFFVRFYAAEREYDDLDRPKSIWKVYLDYAGNRFEGKIHKMGDKLIEVQSLFPNMDRFSSPYEITFNIPMSTLEQGESKVTLTSSLGTAEFDFPTSR